MVGWNLSALLVLSTSASICQALLRTFSAIRSTYSASRTVFYANPITSDGSKYRADITEDEAFLWFDEALVFARAGSGGAGSNAVKFGKARQHVAPSGGSGGDGGSVIFTIDSSINTLLGFRGRSNYRAEHGQPGDLEYQNGLKGTDFYVAVPRGTVIFDNSTKELVGELTKEGQQLIVARGGMGGRGNAALRAKGEKSGCTPPEGGQKRWLKLELKLVADIGLVGVPNAGKSTLLDAVTNAKPKIASYPFTTIVPNLGVCEVGGKVEEGGEALVIADIPGLLEGAHKGVGLGRGFLRHIERCKTVIHIVNGDSADPLGDFSAINRELQLFSPQLAAKPQVVVLNKIDIPHVAEKKDELMKGLLERMSHTRLVAISAAGRIGVEDLLDKTNKFLKKIKRDEEIAAEKAKEATRARKVTGDLQVIEEEDDGDDTDDKKDKDELTDKKTSPQYAPGLFDIKVLKDGTVELSGPGIDALSDEAKIGDDGERSYYGFQDRIDALADAMGLTDAIYAALDQNNVRTSDDKPVKIRAIKSVISTSSSKSSSGNSGNSETVAGAGSSAVTYFELLKNRLTPSRKS